MALNVKANIQSQEALEEAARILKRHIRDSREILALVRQAQVGLHGIEVETIPTQTPSQRSQSDHSSQDPEGAERARLAAGASSP